MLDTKIVYCLFCRKEFKESVYTIARASLCPYCNSFQIQYCYKLKNDKFFGQWFMESLLKHCRTCEERFICWTQR